MNVIHSIEHDSRRVFSANIPNNGAVRNLPWESVLEMPAAATAKGLLPLQLHDFPDNLAAIISRHIEIVETAVDSALNGDRKLFIEAILMGGYITDRGTVEKMVDELIETQAKYLPQFS